MNKIFRTLSFSILVLILSFNNSIAQKWTKIDENDISRSKITRDIVPDKYLTYSININTLRNNLKPSPNRFDEGSSSDVILSIPMSDGTFERFSITRSDVFHPELAKKYPQIKSYTGTSLDEHGTILKLSISHKGINGMILSDKRPTQYIDPYARETKDKYIVYSKRDFHKHLHDGEGGCTVEHPDDKYDPKDISDVRYGDCQLRKYRLALACTGEYANFHGGTVPDVLAEYNASLTRVNGIYERDFAITMELIPNTDEIIYFDGATDPYTNNSGSTMLSENQSNIDDVIGFINYDIGHVYSTGGGGIASLRSPCTTRKARGVTGLGNPVGDPFWVDYVAHEIGHQFGGNHTFNNSCNENRRDATAFEPGSGATIMAYAGICSPNVQNNSDDYFHSITLQEVANFVVAGSGDCAELIDIDNSAPEIDQIFGNGLVLPISTPFQLTAEATDNDDDPLTYCWEQRDNEIAEMPPETDSPDGPSFRSYDPSPDPTRYFPRMSSILFGSNGNTWERLPSVSRSMNFNLAVRDNNMLGGCTADDALSVTFTDTAGPFIVTSQNTNETWNAGTIETITWDVANTDQAPINCTEVDVYLSIDGGESFEILILENTPNDGEQEIDVPFLLSDECRLKVMCASSIFFDVNATEFSIEAPFSASVSPSSLFVCKTDPATYSLDITSFNDNLEITFDVAGAPDGAITTFSPQSTNEDAIVTLEISNLENVLPGTYEMVVSIISDDLTLNQNVTLVVSSDSELPIMYLTPTDAETNVNIFPSFAWESDPSVIEYELQISKNPSFNVIEFSQIINLASTNDASLETQTVYYWRVRPLSTCYESTWNTTQSFQTVGLSCNIEVGESNIIIPESVTEVNSTANFNNSESITQTEVSMLIDHSYVSDLIIELEAPDGDIYTLYDRPGVPESNFGCGNDNLDLIFSDFAPNTAEDLENTCDPGDYAIQGSYMPITSLSGLNGESMEGEWKLNIFDVFDDDGGELLEWTMTLCSQVTLEAAQILTNETLALTNETSKTIGSEYLEIDNSMPENSIFTIRALTSDGDLMITDENSGAMEIMQLGSQFSQEDINEGRVQYMLTNLTADDDQFIFDAVDDENKYLANQEFNITSSFSAISVSTAVSQELLCFGDSNGEITAQGTGGVAPLTYSIDGIEFFDSSVFGALSAGDYTITVRDAVGTETISDVISITQPEELTIILEFSEQEVGIEPQGGTAPYEFSIDGINFVDDNLFQLEDGVTYLFHVKDANGCLITSEEFTHYYISGIDYTSKDVSCTGEADGQLFVATVDGGLAPYLYTLNGFTNTTGQFTGLDALDYNLLVRDAEGNEYQENVMISEPQPLIISTMVIQDSIFVDALGGVAPYTYSLDGVNYGDESILIGQVGESYTIYVQDSNGCITTEDGIEIISSVSSPILDALIMYPNPANNSVQFGHETQIDFEYSIYDINGKNVKNGIGMNDQKIEISNLSQGTYLIKLKIDNSQKAYRLIIVR